ncbi:hypothetical protein GW17_00018860 [Ensete ventricosum]|nr:hypothetical protein GW17_00018860 [Ensete ventricosum]RZS08278.1 hypothetical protein BHM03_00039218 [Ensete ventricosum]
MPSVRVPAVSVVLSNHMAGTLLSQIERADEVFETRFPFGGAGGPRRMGGPDPWGSTWQLEQVESFGDWSDRSRGVTFPQEQIPCLAHLLEQDTASCVPLYGHTWNVITGSGSDAL